MIRRQRIVLSTICTSPPAERTTRARPWRGHRSRCPMTRAILRIRLEGAGAIVSCATSGYLQHVDHGALVAAARAADALIVIRFRPGQFVLRGEQLAEIATSQRTTSASHREANA